MNSESMKAEVNVSEPEFSPVANFFGSQKTSKINGVKCSEYKLSFESKKRFEKKGTDIFEWEEEEYFDYSITQNDHERRVKDEDPTSVKMEGSVRNRTDKRNVYMWLNDQFELSSEEFFTILETIQHGGNVGMQKIYTHLSHENIKDKLEENGFPVKIEIPFGYTVNAKVNFNNFKFIKGRRSSYEDIMPAY
mmetsp:Transcript_3190/g.2662  ORF Transcript_3190/g.2662 Transcript_3190/m.2662 type:complete len:192 (+) Transcript_3190:430-1005(+)